MATLTIFGATGYTGRLCAGQAVAEGIAVRLAGRRPDALARLADELGGDVETAVADVRDPGSLAELAASSDVVLSTVGPYEQHGRPVVEAALAGGCAYLDVTGEVSFLDWVHRQHFRARKAGVTLVPAAGFDGAFGDLLATVAAAALDEPVAEARVAYLVRGGRWSAGTARSALGVARLGGAAGHGDVVEREPPLTHGWRAPFPEPLGPRTAVSVPLPEVVTLGRSVGARRARTYVVAPGAALAGAPGRLLGNVLRLTARTPLWQVLHRAVDLLPEGPDEQERHDTRCAVVVELRGESGARRSAWVRLRDPYGTTATVAVGVAGRLLARGTRAGALTVAQLLEGSCVQFLGDLGVGWALLDGADPVT